MDRDAMVKKLLEVLDSTLDNLNKDKEQLEQEMGKYNKDYFLKGNEPVKNELNEYNEDLERVNKEIDEKEQDKLKVEKYINDRQEPDKEESIENALKEASIKREEALKKREDREAYLKFLLNDRNMSVTDRVKMLENLNDKIDKANNELDKANKELDVLEAEQKKIKEEEMQIDSLCEKYGIEKIINKEQEEIRRTIRERLDRYNNGQEVGGNENSNNFDDQVTGIYGNTNEDKELPKTENGKVIDENRGFFKTLRDMANGDKKSKLDILVNKEGIMITYPNGKKEEISLKELKEENIFNANKDEEKIDVVKNFLAREHIDILPNIDNIDPNLLTVFNRIKDNDNIGENQYKNLLEKYIKSVNGETSNLKEAMNIKYDKTDMKYFKISNLLNKIVHRNEYKEIMENADKAKELKIADVKEDKPGKITTFMKDMFNKVPLIANRKPKMLTGKVEKTQDNEENVLNNNKVRSSFDEGIILKNGDELVQKGMNANKENNLEYQQQSNEGANQDNEKY